LEVSEVLKNVLVAIAGASTFAVLAGCGGGSTGEVIANFNGQEITRDEYLK
jgi:hypothetical protein